MNGQQIIDQFNSFIEDEIDADLSLQLVNDAMHEVEEEVQPLILQKTDTSASTAVGQTYSTAISLPSDIFLPPDEIYVGSDVYKQIPIQKQVMYRDSPFFFWIDWANSQYRLCGTIANAQTISFPYLYKTTDLTVGTSPIWPTRFHRIIAIKMAKMYFAIDQGDKNASWDDRWAAEYERQLYRFKDWDAKLKIRALHGQTPYPEDMVILGADKISL